MARGLRHTVRAWSDEGNQTAGSGQYEGMEQSLRARVRTGEPDAFRTLFNEHARKVYNHAFRVTGSWSAAEEAVALTFLETWRLRTTVNPEGGSLLPWVLGICVNVTRNIARAERRHQAVSAGCRHRWRSRISLMMSPAV